MKPAIQAGRCAECSAAFRLNDYALTYLKGENISTGGKMEQTLILIKSLLMNKSGFSSSD